MRRRAFISLVGGAAATWPFAGRAQQSRRVRRIGMLIGRAATDPEGQSYVSAFRQALQSLGWRAGENVEIEARWQARDTVEARASALELIALDPDVLVINSSPYLRAARQVAGKIPIIFVAIADPVGQGFVESLARPGGNITGFGVEDASMGVKWLELLIEVAPHLTHVTALFNPDTSPNSNIFLSSMQRAVPSAKLERTSAVVRSSTEIERVVAGVGRQGNSGLVVLPDNFLYTRRQMIVELTARHTVPAIYYHTEFAKAGGLIAYGIERVDLFRRAASHVDLVLRGAKPAEIPVQMPTKFELVVNLKTARALGIRIPESITVRADEVIE